MVCHLCGRRRARRHCPALARTICPVCCGTKRLVEIRCPADCSWLAGSRANPPATVLRQRERDARFILSLVHELPERAYVLLLLLQDVARRYRQTAIPPLTDEDVRQSAEALAGTLETADRGIIYEHQAASLTAQRLLAALESAFEDTAKRFATPGLEREAALALRRMERAAREARAQLEDSATAYLDLLARLPYPSPESGEASHAETAETGVNAGRLASSRIIFP